MIPDILLGKLKQIADSQNRPLWSPSLVAGAPSTFDGFPIVINQQLPTPATTTKSVLFGDFSKYLIRDVAADGFGLVRLEERYAELAQVAFLAWMRSDGDLLNAGTGPVKYMDFT
jgi:HK97 family phage major capsid protein